MKGGETAGLRATVAHSFRSLPGRSFHRSINPMDPSTKEHAKQQAETAKQQAIEATEAAKGHAMDASEAVRAHVPRRDALPSAPIICARG